MVGVLFLVTIYVFFSGYYDRPSGAASQYTGVELGIFTLFYAFVRESVYVALGEELFFRGLVGYCGKAPDPFGREEFAGGPLEPPFYGIHVRGALFHTQGGLKVDGEASVLRSDGSVIPGLYAGGGTAVGVSGSGHAGYSSGNGLLAATVLGKIAGEDAAASLSAV